MNENASEETKSADSKEKASWAERILKEWCSVVQLYIHHDNLKQRRIDHFLTIQAALLAFVGLSTKFAFEGASTPRVYMTFLILSSCISIIGALLARTWRDMDIRARKFTLFHRKRIRELENEWRCLFPEDKEGLSTYTSLAIVLEGKILEDSLNIPDEHRGKIRDSYSKDYKMLKETGKTASSREYLAFTVIFLFWICSVIGHVYLLSTLMR